jgi:hypothetical protein
MLEPTNYHTWDEHANLYTIDAVIISENFNGKSPDFMEIGVQACLRFAVISYPGYMY